MLVFILNKMVIAILLVLIILININWSYFSKESKLERTTERETKRRKRIELAKEQETQRKERIQEQEMLRQEKINAERKKYFDLRKQIEQMPIYNRWRQDVINKCGNKCQMCGSTDKLEVHHRISFYQLLKRLNIYSREQAVNSMQLWDTDIGVVLCKECHDKMESSRVYNSMVINN